MQRSKLLNRIRSLLKFMSVRTLHIGMVDADLLDNGTRHPNLAQMKMSAYCKTRGHHVKLLFGDFDIEEFDLLIISKVFTFNNLPTTIQNKMDQYEKLSQANSSIVYEIDSLEQINIKEPVRCAIGGTGFFNDGGRNLDSEIEHIMPDYHLYDAYIDWRESLGHSRKDYDDYENYSIGFASRGCFRKCEFCVNKKYDHAFRHAPVSEFLDETRSKIYLWDDNVFALYNGWEDIFEELKRTNKPFQFRQGLDMRLMNEKHAKVLSECKYYGDYIFAFDNIDEAIIIERKLDMWRLYCTKTTKLYVLCAFYPYEKIKKWDEENLHDPESIAMRDEIVEKFELLDIIDTFERIRILMKYGCLPYIMRYDLYKLSEFKDIYIQLARWCNQPDFFKKKSFREFCEANQNYSKNSTEMCASYQAMIDFESRHPDIADKYFDLKFDNINEYHTVSSYGRRSIACKHCNRRGITWKNLVDKAVEEEKILSEYYRKNLDLLCLKNVNRRCNVQIDLAAQRLVSIILNTSYEKILELIDDSENIPLDSNAIPQPGDLETITQKLLKLFETGDKFTFEEIGERLSHIEKTPTANKKFGESYSKFAALLDLVILDSSKLTTVSLSPLGKIINAINPTKKNDFCCRQILRIPIVQNLIRSSKFGKVSIEDQLKVLVSGKTVGRRIAAVNFFLRVLKKSNSYDIERRLENITDFKND